MTAHDAHGGVQVISVDSSPETLASQRQPAPPDMATTRTPHPFFKKTSEKIAERRQARELEASRPVRDPTPASLSDHESTEYVPPKAKRQRKKTKTESVSRPKHVRPAIEKSTEVASADKLPTSPPPNLLLQSMKSDIDPVTAAAAPFSPAPSLPLPHAGDDVTPVMVDEPHAAPDFEVDPNQSTRKRRRTSPRTVVTFKVDTETGMLLRSSSPAESVQSAEDVTKPGFAPERSQIPSLPETVDFDPEKLKQRMHWRAECVRDSGRHLLILKSSPPLEDPPSVSDEAAKIPVEETTKKPALRNAFALLGKKKPVEKPAPDVITDTDDEKPKKRTSARTKKRSPTDITTVSEKLDHGEKPEVKTIDLQSSSPARDPPTANPDPQPPKPAPPTSTHPFFSAAGRKKLAQSAPPPALEALPEETKESQIESNSRASEQKPRIVVPGVSFRPTGFSKHVQKTPGMLEPAWPAKGTTHVRGLDPPDSVDRDCPFSRTKKLKSHQVTIAPAENILTKICHDVNLREVETTVKHPDYRTHSYLTIPPEVRLPKRLVTTSSQLQDMVRPRTQARLLHPKALAHKIAADSDSESDMALGPGGKVHPALMNLYIRLGHELTAFDTNTFDTHPWEVKYAPQRGCDVLQPTKEMEVLETWLIGLRTELFDVPDPRKRKPRKTAPKGVVKKKRKKGGDDLNGFVVTSEEEMNYMDELTDPDEEEGDWTVATAKSKKSTIRSGDKDLFQDLGDDATDAKKTNAVLISGPTGCGKSAAVYAVAKQLGYTVFEVSPGSRRNGKDLLDLVGDMSRNHLVHQAKAAAESTNPFSRARAAAGRETTPQSVTSEDAGRPQQSLILLEEVDILFEEDKTFWSSVVTLMAKSKRPIIMTCNDEEVIPLDTLSLHAILRFSRPPVDLIVDYLILMAANEGHLLQTQCVRDLVHANYRDLRRCIMELQFHCRIGVGDRTGSLNWQIIRFPHGCDVADSGEVMRVVSVDTYREGMGWLDFAPSAREEERWEHVWDQFGVDVATQDAGLESCVRAITDGNGMGRKEALGLTVEFLEARSVADAVSRGAMSASHQPQIDATHPERTSATILDDQVGYPTLSTPLHPSTTDRAVTIAAHHLAWSFFSVATKQHTPYPPTPNSTTILTAVTNRHLPPTPTITDEPLFSPIHYQALFHPFSLFHPKFAFTPQLVHSCVYPGTTALVEEAAPMIRGILRHDVADERRRRKAGLMSAGGKRKTRAARMALEGKGRGGRGDRWFLGVGAEVLVTCGERWGEAVEWAMQRKVNESGDGENTESCEEMEMKS